MAEETKRLEALRESEKDEAMKMAYLKLLLEESGNIENKVLLFSVLKVNENWGELRSWAERNYEQSLLLFEEEVTNKLLEAQISKEGIVQFQEKKSEQEVFTASDKTELDRLEDRDEKLAKVAANSLRTFEALSGGNSVTKVEGLADDIKSFSSIDKGMRLVLKPRVGGFALDFPIYVDKPTNLGKFADRVAGQSLKADVEFEVLDTNKVGLRRYPWLEVRFVNESGEIIEGWFSWENIISRTYKIN